MSRGFYFARVSAKSVGMINIFFVTLILLCLATPSFAQDDSEAAGFKRWLDDFKRDAQTQGISNQTLDDAFAETEFIGRVIELDRKQPEGTITLETYLQKAISDRRIEEGRELYSQYKDLLQEISHKYGVQPQFIVALWGIETSYGANTGGFDIIDSLATLAYEGRRAHFFRDELIKALHIVEQEHRSAAEMQGSWAGAMGQCQFMPSSFLRFAVDYDKDGKRDIWDSQADVFASIANYLDASGWDGDIGWGHAVTLPEGFDTALTDIKQEKRVREWQTLGVRTTSGGDLPNPGVRASVVMVGSGGDAAPYIIYGNYKVLLKWNRSRYFATAVGTLADEIAE